MNFVWALIRLGETAGSGIDGFHPRATQSTDPQRERALAHPLRARILEILHRRPADPEELAEELHVSVEVIAYHLGVLTRAGCLPPGSRLSTGDAAD